MNILGECPYLKIDGDWNKYYSSLSKNWRHDLRKKHNRLNKKSLTYTFQSIKKDINDEFISKLLIMHSRVLKSQGISSVLDLNEAQLFVKSIVRKFQDLGWIVLDLMYIDDEIASYTLGFQYGGKYFHWNIGREPKYDWYSPGNLILEDILMEYFRSNLFNEVDFMRGEENWKSRWTNLYRKNYRVTIYNNKFFILAIKIKAFLLKVKNRTIFSNESLHIFERETLKELPDYRIIDNIDTKIANNEEISRLAFRFWSVNREKRFEEFLAKKYNCIIAKDTDNNIWGYCWIAYETYFLNSS